MSTHSARTVSRSTIHLATILAFCAYLVLRELQRQGWIASEFVLLSALFAPITAVGLMSLQKWRSRFAGRFARARVTAQRVVMGSIVAIEDGRADAVHVSEFMLPGHGKASLVDVAPFVVRTDSGELVRVGRDADVSPDAKLTVGVRVEVLGPGEERRDGIYRDGEPQFAFVGSHEEKVLVAIAG